MAKHNISVTLLVFLILLHEHEHLVVATTDANVLVATLNYISGWVFSINLLVGTSPQKLPLLLDVQSPFTTLHCTNQDLNSSSSSSFHPSLSSTFLTPYSSPATCIAPLPYNPSMSSCNCAQDTINLSIERTDFPDPLLSTNVSAVNFTCCADEAVSSLTGAAGVAGLGRGDRSLTAQISKSAGLARQFSYCLPSLAFFGRVTTYARLNGRAGLMQTFTTSLQTRLYYVKGGGYAYKLQNMTMLGRYYTEGRGVMRKPLKMRVSTTQTYTTLERSVYKAFRQQFRQAVGYKSVAKPVPAMDPFDTCFDTTELYNVNQSPYLKTPYLSFEVEGGGGWILYPHNTFVYINGSSSAVACMGFLKAAPGQPSVLGTFQQLDCVAEFDLEHSRFGFTPIFNANAYNYDDTPSCSQLQYPMYV